MNAANFTKIAAIGLPLALAACATPPQHINDVCAVFDQRDGWFDDWQAAASRAERRHGVPVPVLMATLRKESGFRRHARPPRTKLLGFIPWTRPSSAYGFSQALDGTWDQYRQETGNWTARRSRFADAVDFVGWYHGKTAERFGVAPSDAFNLYLAYYVGWTGYGRGDWRGNASLLRTARAADTMARTYAAQLRQCR